LKTDWLCLDCELMSWSVKAQELLRLQYAPVGTAGIHALVAAQQVLAEAELKEANLEELRQHTDARLASLIKYRDACRQYCWPVNSIQDLKLAPFHLLASEGAVHVDNTINSAVVRHAWMNSVFHNTTTWWVDSRRAGE